MIDLLLAMVMLNVGILALVAAFNSGALALSRANRLATATTLAEQQMELLRGIKYANIEQTSTAWTAATNDSTWTADTVYQTKMKTPTSPVALIGTVTTCPNSTADSNGYTCNPSYTKTGPDGRSYRVDTYMYYDASPNSNGQIKVVTVVVRDANNLGGYFARQTSTFDPTTGS